MNIEEQNNIVPSIETRVSVAEKGRKYNPKPEADRGIKAKLFEIKSLSGVILRSSLSGKSLLFYSHIVPGTALCH